MKKRVLIVGGILIAIGIAGGIGWRYYDENIRVASSENVAYVSEISDIIGTSNGVTNRFAGVVEPQKTLEVELESGRTVKEVYVEAGDVVKSGQLLFEYDLSSIEEDIQETQLELDRLVNEALSLTEQISTLEKEKTKASSDNQLSYTIEIETNKMNLKQNEYNQKSKQAELEKLQNALGNTEVRSEIEGVIQKIDTSKMQDNDSESSMNYSYSYDDDSNSNAFITILSTGAYQVKGSFNEQNKNEISEGDSVIVYSRVDETQMWKGVISSIDRENSTSNNSNSYYYYGSSDSMTFSSSYPFYVELENSNDLMLGQHVYIESDNGQAEKKKGLWLSEFYIADLYENNPYVWAENSQGRLEKREVVLGEYDADLAEYEILEGLSLTDRIAFPSDNLEEGMKTADSSMQADIDYDYSDDVNDYDYSDEDFIYMDEDMENYYEDDDMDDAIFLDEEGIEDDVIDDEITFDEDASYHEENFIDDEIFLDEEEMEILE